MMHEKREDTARASEVIIVLGAPNDASGQLSAIAVERAKGAVREYKRRPGSKLLLTGGYGAHFNQAEKPHAYYVAQYLLSHGLPEADILEFAESANTVEDAILSSQILANYKLKTICVVTSKVHLKRARLIFEHFFDPNILTFVGVADAVSPERLQVLRQHEARRIGEIQKQGGIIFGGERSVIKIDSDRELC